MAGHRAAGAVSFAAWLTAAGLATNAALRIVAHDGLWLTILSNSLTPYLYLPAHAVLAFAAWQRRYGLIALAAPVVACHLFWTLQPLGRAEHDATRRAGAKPLRVFSSNVLAWNASTAGISREILESGADVIAVQELSPRWAQAFAGPAFSRAYPHRIEEVRKDAFGSGIYSREPLLDADILQTPAMPIARATIALEGSPVRIYSVHPPPPSHPALVRLWESGLTEVLAAARRETLPVVLAGDFNATEHSAWHARFMDEGYRSAHDACRRPFATTWPNGMLRMLPIRIDHVFFSRELGCVSVREGAGAGSDHRPVIVELVRR